MFVVIMAGGSGTRFWPASRKNHPKQFLNITGKGPMVVETCDRLKPIAGDDEMILVLGQEHLEIARGLFGDRGVHLLGEPVGRNTAPAIGLGAIYARHLGCEESMAFLPADHFIGNPSAFLEALRAAGELANSGGIVTLGIVPNRPETGYGYIRRDQTHVDSCGLKAYRVSEFVEKPGLKKAHSYLTSGEYYWNSGIFVATPQTILQETKKLLPELYESLLRLDRVLGTPQFDTELRDVYDTVSGISFDYGIMEKTTAKLYVLPCECGWSDIGSWASLYELRTPDHDADHNLADGNTLLIDCKQSFISSGNSGRLVACVGMNNYLVVDTPEALLVADLDRSQDIGRIMDYLKRTGKDELL